MKGKKLKIAFNFQKCLYLFMQGSLQGRRDIYLFDYLFLLMSFLVLHIVHMTMITGRH